MDAVNPVSRFERSSPMRRHAWRSIHAAGMAAALVALALFAVSGCGGKSKPTNDDSAVARRAVQALIDHDNQAYLDELLPDYVSDPAHAPDANQDLAGCSIKDVRTAATGSSNITVIFASPCGAANKTDSTPRKLVGCSVSLTASSGRAYVQDYACTS
jgi:hypothetical protein